MIDQAVCLGQEPALAAGRPSIRSTPTNPSPAPVVNLNSPDQFDGTRSKFGSYITKLQLQFRSNPRAFSTEESRILYAGSYLTGSAYTWFEPNIDQTSGTVTFATFSEFLESLRAAYDDPDAYATSERQIEALRQETSCASYYAKMMSLFSQLGWAEPRVQIHYFLRGLKDIVKDVLIGKNMLTTFSEYSSVCIALDSEIYARCYGLTVV